MKTLKRIVAMVMALVTIGSLTCIDANAYLLNTTYIEKGSKADVTPTQFIYFNQKEVTSFKTDVNLLINVTDTEGNVIHQIYVDYTSTVEEYIAFLERLYARNNLNIEDDYGEDYKETITKGIGRMIFEPVDEYTDISKVNKEMTVALEDPTVETIDIFGDKFPGYDLVLDWYSYNFSTGCFDTIQQKNNNYVAYYKTNLGIPYEEIVVDIPSEVYLERHYLNKGGVLVQVYKDYYNEEIDYPDTIPYYDLLITSESGDPEDLTITRIDDEDVLNNLTDEELHEKYGIYCVQGYSVDSEDETINILIEEEGESLGEGIRKLTHYHIVYYPTEDRLEYTNTVVGKLYAEGSFSTEDDITIGDSEDNSTITEPSETTLQRGDINGDGAINALDLLQLKKYILGIIDSLD